MHAVAISHGRESEGMRVNDEQGALPTWQGGIPIAALIGFRVAEICWTPLEGTARLVVSSTGRK